MSGSGHDADDVYRDLWRGRVARFVAFTLKDGETQMMFEAAESDQAALPGEPGEKEPVSPGGRLTERLQVAAEAAREVAESLRSQLAPDEVNLEFGLQISGEVSWFFAKAQSQSTIKVSLKWVRDGTTDASSASDA
jgi:NTP-dependent ternary system trypsin peptidase co-occuring protein